MKVLKFNETVDIHGVHYYKKIDSSASSEYVKVDGIKHYYMKIFVVGDYIKIIKDPDAVNLEDYSKYLPSNENEFNSAMENAIKFLVN